MMRSELVLATAAMLAALAACGCNRAQGDRMTRDFDGALCGVVNYADWETALSDCSSAFGVVDIGVHGIGGVMVAYNRRPARLGERLLALSVIGEDGREIIGPKAKGQTRHYPHGIERTTEAGSLVLRELVSFIGEDSVALAVRVENRGSDPKIVSVKLSGSLVIDGGKTARAAFENGLLVIDAVIPRTDGRDPDETFDVTLAVRSASPVASWDASLAGHELVTEPVGLMTNHHLDTVFVLGMTIGDHALAVERALAEAPKSLKELRHASSERWNSVFASMPVPPTHKELYYHCGFVLMQNLYPAIGLYSPYTAGCPAKGHYCAHWVWDSAFHAVGLSEWSPKLARDAVDILAANIEDDGRVPLFVCPTWRRPEPDSQPPVIAWAAAVTQQREADTDFFGRIYDPLRRFNRFWFEHRDIDGDGLCEYQGPVESGWDTTPRFEGSSWDRRFAALDLNSFLVVQMRCLSLMARELGKPDEAAEWQRKATELAARIVDVMYDPDYGIFWDRWVHTHEPNKVLTPACFMPLWAGVPIERDVAEAMIRTYLLSEEHFWGDVPFPIVARSDPRYTPHDYWRGPVWIHFAYFMTEVLHKYGFEAEAAQARERLLDMAEAGSFIGEYYHGESGQPLGAKEYGWSATFFIEMILGRHLPVFD